MEMITEEQTQTGMTQSPPGRWRKRDQVIGKDAHHLIFMLICVPITAEPMKSEKTDYTRT